MFECTAYNTSELPDKHASTTGKFSSVSICVFIHCKIALL